MGYTGCGVGGWQLITIRNPQPAVTSSHGTRLYVAERSFESKPSCEFQGQMFGRLLIVSEPKEQLESLAPHFVTIPLIGLHRLEKG